MPRRPNASPKKPRISTEIEGHPSLPAVRPLDTVHAPEDIKRAILDLSTDEEIVWAATSLAIEGWLPPNVSGGKAEAASRVVEQALLQLDTKPAKHSFKARLVFQLPVTDTADADVMASIAARMFELLAPALPSEVTADAIRVSVQTTTPPPDRDLRRRTRALVGICKRLGAGALARIVICDGWTAVVETNTGRRVLVWTSIDGRVHGRIHQLPKGT